MNAAIEPILLYLACAIGAVGVWLALPRRKGGPAILGGLIVGAGIGLALLVMAFNAFRAEQLPNLLFYGFSALAIASALRMITHQRPVYSALYFVLTILASSGLYVLMSAEFMAFALIIIYAGAILITYLFVIMLATQAPTAGSGEDLSDYDAEARDPLVASIVGFALLAVLSTAMFRGTAELPPPADAQIEESIVLGRLPGKLDTELEIAGLLAEGESVVTVDGIADVDMVGGTGVLVADPDGLQRRIPVEDWPKEARATNVERLGSNLLADHPMTIEIAGVILLMAMLGATILARQQVELEEEAKERQARRLRSAAAEKGVE